MNGYQFERFRDRRGKYRFRFTAPNNEKMFQSEGYDTWQKRNSAIKRIQEKAAGAEVVDAQVRGGKG